MSDLQQFKCPACGGTITYNGTSNKLKCNYCGTEFDLDALSQYNQNLNQSIEREDFKFENPDTVWAEDANDVHYYICNSCGGEIITDDDEVQDGIEGDIGCFPCGNDCYRKYKQNEVEL